MLNAKSSTVIFDCQIKREIKRTQWQDPIISIEKQQIYRILSTFANRTIVYCQQHFKITIKMKKLILFASALIVMCLASCGGNSKKECSQSCQTETCALQEACMKQDACSKQDTCAMDSCKKACAKMQNCAQDSCKSMCEKEAGCKKACEMKKDCKKCTDCKKCAECPKKSECKKNSGCEKKS